MDVYTAEPLKLSVADLDEKIDAIKVFYNGFVNSTNINR